MSYEEIDHTADWAFRVTAPTLPELFTNAAAAIFALEGAIDTQSTFTREVQVEGMDRETLLVNWLNELLFLQETRRETYQKFELTQFSDTALRATIHGAPSSPTMKFIKAVTFHDLELVQTETGWKTTIVVDV